MKKKSIVLASVLAMTMTMGLAAPVFAGEASASSAASSAAAASSSAAGESDKAAHTAASSADAAASSADAAEQPAGKEESILDALFGSEGIVPGMLPEGVSVGDVFEAAGEKLGVKDTPVYQNVDNFLKEYSKEDGSLDWAKLGESLQGLEGLLSESTVDASALDEYLASYDKVDEALKDYLFEMNAEFMDPGDVQIFSKKPAFVDDIEKDEIKVLAELTQDNFKIENDEMIMASGSSVPMLLTLVKDAEGNFKVTDCKQAEDGEGYTDSIKVMCDEVGITFDDYTASMKLCEYNDEDALVEYLEAHPEIKGAKYMGEIKTAEELKKMSDDYMEELFGGM